MFTPFGYVSNTVDFIAGFHLCLHSPSRGGRLVSQGRRRHIHCRRESQVESFQRLSKCGHYCTHTLSRRGIPRGPRDFAPRYILPKGNLEVISWGCLPEFAWESVEGNLEGWGKSRGSREISRVEGNLEGLSEILRVKGNLKGWGKSRGSRKVSEFEGNLEGRGKSRRSG